MPRDFLLIFRTRTPTAQRDFRALLEQEQIAFRDLCFQFGRPEKSPDVFVENLYFIEADFVRLSSLKQTIEITLQYDALLLFEYVSW